MNEPRDPQVEAEKKAENEVKYWMEELDLAKKRESEYLEVGHRVTEIYEACKTRQVPFNILYSNTEVLIPSLYSDTPRSVIKARLKNGNPIANAVAKVCEKTADYMLDPNNEEYTPFDALLNHAVLCALLPGRGITRFKYEAKMGEETKDEAGNAVPGELQYEYVCGEVIPWDRYREGYAKCWKDVPWIGYMHVMDAEELEQNFGSIAQQVPVNAESEDTKSEEKNRGQKKTANVWEIWDKGAKKVLFISESYPKAVLKKVDAPLRLSGFFPQPEPLCFTLKLSSRVPTAMYLWYEEQAQELNDITTRIRRIVQALKVRGFYNDTVEGIEKVLKAEDNELIPAENSATLGENSKMDNAIWLVPIEKLVTVLQQLYTQREAVKGVIYEIMGIADILRGNTQASETATAQNLKSQWGSLRLKRAQKLVRVYARNCIRIMLEIAGTNFSQTTLQKITELPYPTQEDQEKASAEIERLTQEAAMQAQMAEQQMAMQPGMEPPPPPQPPQIDPKLQEIVDSPVIWEALMKALQDDMARQLHVDVETNSTVMSDEAEDQKNVSELMNAISQFLNGVMPMMQEGYMPFDVMKAMLLGTVRKFNFGREVEDQLEKMQAPEPKPDPKQQELEMKAKAEQEKQAGESRMKQEQHQLDLQMQQAELDHKTALRQMELQAAQAKMQIDIQMMQQKAAMASQSHQQKMQQMAMQATMPAKPEASPAEN